MYLSTYIFTFVTPDSRLAYAYQTMSLCICLLLNTHYLKTLYLMLFIENNTCTVCQVIDWNNKNI